jgi:hypothetical protein
MSRKTKFKAYDQRTGRLERAIDLIEDGDTKGIMVHRREADQEHPLRRPIRIGPDRSQVFRRGMQYRTAEGHMQIDVGYYGTGSNFERASIPSVNISSGFGTITISYPTGGYGEFGYGGYEDGQGIYGYGGTASGGDEGTF